MGSVPPLPQPESRRWSRVKRSARGLGWFVWLESACVPEEEEGGGEEAEEGAVECAGGVLLGGGGVDGR